MIEEVSEKTDDYEELSPPDRRLNDLNSELI
jgi:hypothetical protein